jgi:hypothetical protein
LYISSGPFLQSASLGDERGSTVAASRVPLLRRCGRGRGRLARPGHHGHYRDLAFSPAVPPDPRRHRRCPRLAPDDTDEPPRALGWRSSARGTSRSRVWLPATHPSPSDCPTRRRSPAGPGPRWTRRCGRFWETTCVWTLSKSWSKAIRPRSSYVALRVRTCSSSAPAAMVASIGYLSDRSVKSVSGTQPAP